MSVKKIGTEFNVCYVNMDQLVHFNSVDGTGFDGSSCITVYLNLGLKSIFKVYIAYGDNNDDLFQKDLDVLHRRQTKLTEGTK